MSPDKRWSKLSSSFQFKLFLIFTLLTFLIACLLCTLYVVHETNEARNHTTEKLQMRAKLLGDSIRLPLYAENRDLLHQMAKQAAQAPEISTVVITAPDGRELVNVHPPGTHNPTSVISQSVEVRSSYQMISIDSWVAGAHENSEIPIGTVRMEQGTESLSRAVGQIIFFSICTAIGFWVAVSLLCYIVLRRLTTSFNALVQGINTLQDGDFACRIKIESDDEAGRAARAVNNLAITLHQRSEENIRLQEESLNFERQMLHSQKLESLGVMAGGIAHDFNNLLQSILGNMELASMALAPNSKPQKYIADSMITGKRAAKLTSLMLTYVGKGFITKKELNLNDLVRENVDMLKSAVSTSVSIKLHLSAELPAIIADEAQMQQLTMNLITNAAESIEKQPGLVRISTGIQSCDQACLAATLLDEKPEPGSYVYLEVNDNGCGMSSETVKRLFDPFFTTKFTGRGLGMSAVMGIIKSHHGALLLKSKPGKGTIFRALFPIPESAEPATAQSHPPPNPSTSLRTGLPLENGWTKNSPEKSTLPENPLSGMALVVDDEKSVLRTCTKMVKLCGFTVITACDGIDAVAKFREHADEIVVVLMDLTMPNIDGITAMSEIYSIKPDTKIILSSGFNEEELSERITSQPPSGFIRKPYSMNAIETELRRVIQAN